MGQSGAGGGGAGSGGSGGSGSGGGGGYGAPKPKNEPHDLAQRVLRRINRQYLERHYIGTLVPGLVKDLILMAVDLRRGGNWRALCARLELPEQASLQEVRNALFDKNSGREHDQRLLGASRAAMQLFFDELTSYDDDLLSKRRQGSTWSGSIDQQVLDHTLTNFLTLLTEQILLREEPTILQDVELDGLRAMAKARADTLEAALRKRYQASGDAGDARLLERAASANVNDRTWFVDALRG